MSEYNTGVAMNNNFTEGWLRGARQCPSPNYGPRPEGVSPSLLVIHNISLPPGEFGGSAIERLFCNGLDWEAHPFFEEIRGAEVSSHFLVRRDGELVQFVSCEQRAWHAGRSCYEGRENCNDFSIGIELEGTDDLAYEECQYRVLAELTQTLLRAYPELSVNDITGHSDIAPGRKTDPGPAFDWDGYRRTLSSVRE